MRNVRRIDWRLAVLALGLALPRIASAQVPQVSTLTNLDDVVHGGWSTNALPFPPSVHYRTDLGVVAYDEGFDTNFVAQLSPDTNGVVIVYPLLAVEDSNSLPRVRYLFNGTGALVRTLSPPPEYSASNWVEEVYGDPPIWLSGSELDAWYADRDPARQEVGLSLIATGSVPAYLESRTNQAASGGGGGIGSNQVGIVQLQAGAAGATLYLHAPVGVTHVDVFDQDNLTNATASPMAWNCWCSAPTGTTRTRMTTSSTTDRRP